MGWHRSLSSQIKVVAASTVGLSLGLSAVTVSSFGTFMLPLTHEFGWQRGDISLAITIFTLTTIVAAPIAGVMIDRWGIRRVLLPSIAAFALALASLALMSGGIWRLYVGYALLGAFGIGTASVTYSRLLIQWFTERRGLALGVALSGMGVGVAVLPSLAQYIIDAYGWRGAYIGLAVVVFIVSFPIVALWGHEPALLGDATAEMTDQTTVAALTGLSFGKAIRSKSVLLMIFAFLMLGVSTGAMPTHLVPLLIDRGTSPTQAALYASALGFSLVIGGLIVGFLLDRMSAALLILIVIAGLVTGLVMLLSGVSGPLAIVAIALVGFSIGADGDFMPYLVSRYVGMNAFSRITAILFGAFSLGIAVGPIVMGYGVDLTGSYALGLKLLIGCSLLAALPFFLIGPYPALLEP